MLNQKSTIYQAGWLDLVFADRNKSYGAYELRQNYNKRLGRALLISSTLMITLISAPLLKNKIFPTVVAVSTPAIEPRIIPVDLVKPVQKLEESPAAAKAEPEKIKTVRYIEMVAVKGPVVEDPPSMKEIETAIVGPQNIEGPEVASSVNASASAQGSGSGAGIAPGSEAGDALISTELLEKYPEFPGGMEAFAKYLRKNLRYPDRAVQAGIQGRVFVSFVVEKDGRLTDVKVLRGIGYGCDEEATRVLKKSPLWNPGIQNKREVRVLYTIPLVFQMGE